jgi:membrane protease YdiL (CAAX protease family)
MTEPSVTHWFVRLPRWGRILSHILVIFAASLIYITITNYLLVITEDLTIPPVPLLELGLVQLALLLLATWFIRRVLLRLPVFPVLGMVFQSGKVLATVPWFVVGGGMATVAVLVILALGSITIAAGSAGAEIAVELIVLALFALFEEALFRGALWGWIAPRWGFWIALVVTSLLFSIFHIGEVGSQWLGIANVLGAGILLGMLRQMGGSIWAAWGWHWGWNAALAIGFGDWLSGTLRFPQTLGVIFTDERVWLNGGHFGIEGSLVTFALLGIASIILIIIKRKSLTNSG